MRIGILTDTHLGFTNLNCPPEQSFDVFDEALQVFRSNHCDLVVHCGDLFNWDSCNEPNCAHAIEIIQKNIQGKKNKLQCESFDGLQQLPNWTKSSNSINLPIFLIHGNHDSPKLDENHFKNTKMIGDSRLVNLFHDSFNITTSDGNPTSQKIIFPVIVKKENVRLLIYGVNHDKKFKELSQDGHLILAEIPNEKYIRTFRIALIHQGDSPSCIANMFYKYKIDFIFIGHKHAVRIDPVYYQNIRVVYPGSTMEMSNSQSHPSQRYVAILDITTDDDKFYKIPLNLRWKELIIS